MSFLSMLSREQKVSFGLLQFGTFLEYFDLYLYIHLSVLLNDLFFPQADPRTSSLLSALAFCSIFVVRPFAALVIGHIGDTIGRKTTILLTTFLMAISCIIMANLPTYSQIGIAASWLIIMCRVFQGFSSMGEVIGAQIYLTEIVKPPLRYPVVSSITATVGLGSMAALIVSNLVTTQGFDWRIAFWAGAFIAIIGLAARTRLKETPDFIDMKRRMKKAMETTHDKAHQTMNLDTILKERTTLKTMAAYFAIECTAPLGLFIAYIYMGSVLKDTFGFTSHQVIQQNLIVMMFTVSRYIFVAYLSSKVHPLRIVKAQLYLFVPFILIYPYFLVTHLTVLTVLMFQILSECLIPIIHPAAGVIYAHFPVMRRFTSISFIYATTRALMHVITSFGAIYVAFYTGHAGLLIVIVPVTAAFAWGLRHFEKLEQNNSEANYSLAFSGKPQALQALKTGT